VTKPLHYEEMLARINAHLTIRDQQRLEALNASKDKFFSIIAHDLKSPVSGFLGLASLLENIERLKPEQIQRLTRQFRQSAEHLLTLLENLLTWSRLQRGLIECHPDRVPVRRMVERNMTLLASPAGQKRITLSAEVPGNLEANADMNMIDTVIRNALSNAIKFTKPSGTITITAEPEGNMVRISIADTGVGIPAEKLATLFHIDAKTQREGTAGERGTGLGLLLCREFVEKNGGAITMESQVDQGSTLSFTVPAATQ
jgi:signal transduction histidine kinase